MPPGPSAATTYRPGDVEDDGLRNATMADCILTDAAWTDNEVYEGIYEPLREAMTRLQKSKASTRGVLM
jgi:hypothetical protein